MFRRLRRLRQNKNIRQIIRQNTISVNDLIYPLFVIDGKGVRNEISSMPGVYQLSIDNILYECEELLSLGIRAIVLFGIPSNKDAYGSSCMEGSIVARCIEAIKTRRFDICVIADVCLCEYTDHGHCGVVLSGDVDNDRTLELLAAQSLVLARAGADMLAPSSMMDGQISAIRNALDTNSLCNLPIMSYSTKFASSYYGPFREVANSTPQFGDRRSYQMDCANGNEALLESIEDEVQGADILMVKPALAYLDIVARLSQRSLLPIAVYNVSGEYALLQAGRRLGIVDYDNLVLENMIAFKRAGASLIISYHAKEVARLIIE